MHEIVRLVQPDFLVNSSRRACRYETADRRPLAPGYYFALWGPKATARTYDHTVRYFGPFATGEEAQLVQHCAEYLGLVAPTPAAARHNGAPLTQAVRNAYTALLNMVRGHDAPLKRCGAPK